MEVYSVVPPQALMGSSVPSSSNVPAVVDSNESLVGRYCGKKMPGPIVSEVGNLGVSLPENQNQEKLWKIGFL